MGDSAVIINEFGEVGLDHLLVEAVDGEIAVLPSGCVCCTLRSDLQQTINDLLIRRDRAEIPPFREFWWRPPASPIRLRSFSSS